MIGKTIIELDSVDSTNAYASRMYDTIPFEDGTIIWTHEQYAGQGQRDRRWSSEAGKNLTFTVCLKPWFLAPDRQFQLNKAIALGVLDFIRSFLVSGRHSNHPVTGIKWPNDIYAGGHKIGGILIENMIMGSIFETSFVGIGININQTRFEPEIPNPVSLIQILGHEIPLKEALLSLCRFLDRRYGQLPEIGSEQIDQAFDHNLLGFDVWRSFSCNGAPLEGKIKGVDDTGRLIVENIAGETHYFNHQEINYLFNRE